MTNAKVQLDPPLMFKECRKQPWYGPGVLLYLMLPNEDNKKVLLVGDINELGGVCDDCTGIRAPDIVLAYQRIWADLD